MPRPANGFRDGKALVRVHHEFEFRPECAAHGGQSRHILCDMRPPDLDLDAAEPLFPRRHRTIDKFLRGEVQPAAFRVIDRYACLRATGHDMKRGPGALATEVPERHVDGRERQAHGCAHRVGMGVEEETLPDLFHHRRIAPQQPWRHVVTQKRHNSGAAGSDRIAVSGAIRSVVRPDADDRGLLLGEGLDCVATHRLRRQIHLEDLNASNFRHCDGNHLSQPTAASMCTLRLPPVPGVKRSLPSLHPQPSPHW